MAIAFRGNTNGSAGTADPVAAIALPTGTVAGDLVGLFLMFKYDSVTIAAQPSNWQDPTDNEETGGAGASGIDTGVVRVASWWREYDGVWSMPSIDLSAAPNVSGFSSSSFSKAVDEAWDAVVCTRASDTTGSTTSYDPPAAAQIPIRTDDWIIAHTGINGDAGTATTPGTLTVAGLTLGTGVARINLPSSSGQDLRQLMGTWPVNSGDASGGPDLSIAYSAANASMAGATVFSRLRVTRARPVRPRLTQAWQRAATW